MHAYKRYALVCAVLTCIPILCYWKLNVEDNKVDSWGPALIHGTDGSASRINTTPTLISLDHSGALKLIQDAGYPLDLEFGESFNNETGAGRFIVPNIVHYIRFKQPRFTFVEYVCLRSVHINHQPDYIFIHTDVHDGFKGKYWRWIQKEKDLFSRLRILPIEAPSEIFGQKLSEKWRLLHGSDIARAKTMMKYGGIYLDNDVYVIRSLDVYRQFEMVLGWAQNDTMGTQVLIGHRNCRFLPLWLETYRDYHSDDWYLNAGGLPTKEVLEKRPGIVHRVEQGFGVQVLHYQLYEDLGWDGWHKMDTIHLLSNHRFYIDSHFNETPIYQVFNERNIQHYPFAFGDMARLVLNPSL